MILRANERAGRTITVFALLVVLVFGVASLKAAPASVAAANSPEAVSTAFQMDATHDGDQPNETLTAPTKEWTHAFTGVVSYPLIVGGRIFVTVANPVDSNGDGVYGSSLWALSASNGSVLWGPIALGGTYDFSGATYDNGRVFAINEDGDLWAFDAASGHQYWEEQLPPQTQFSSLPTAYGGVVYVGGSGTSGTLYAVNETDGTILWRNDVLNGDNSSPAVTATGVYVTYAEDQDYDFSLGGTLVWHDTDDGFEGGGGRTPAYYDGNLYVRDTDDSVPGRMLDGGTGAQLGTYTSQTIPAFDDGLEFTETHGTLSAIQLSTGNVLWSQTADGTLDSAPIVVGGTVYIGGTSGLVAGFNESTGAETWSANAGSPVLFPDESDIHQMPGLGAGDDLLVVPASDSLVAFGSSGGASPPPPSGGTTPTQPSGGTTPTSTPGGAAPTAPTTTGSTWSSPPGGYSMAAADGGVFTFGAAEFLGSQGGKRLDRPIVAVARTPDGQGYWEVASDGGIFAFGDAGFYGSEGGKPLNSAIVGMATTPDGKGYWEVAADGGIFAFGNAGFYGSQGGHPLNRPIVGMAASPDGDGYWEVAGDGGIFNFGDSAFFGSQGGHPLNRPIVGMASSHDGEGYWEVASDGGIFSFGDAQFLGSQGGQPLNRPIVGIATTPDGLGYWEVASDGGIFNFGDAAYFGSQGGKPLDSPIVGMVGG